jgi:molecular chaperone GrpE (heat shock protein)
MNRRATPRISKWAFLLGDLLLLLVAGWIVHRQPVELSVGQGALVVVAVALGAWLAAAPFILEYRAALRFAEADELASVVSQIQKLEAVGDQVRLATGQWQTVQEHAERTVTAAQEIGERIAAEAKNFTEFLKKANDAEKAHLRLEVDKAKRAETEWLQVVVRMLDHVYALYMAGMHSNQPRLREQLTQFQTACREIVRRVGLVPVEAAVGEAFDEMKHQSAEGEGAPLAGAVITETVATGYTFQGRLLRPPIVRVQPTTEPNVDEPPQAEAPPGGEPTQVPANSADAPVGLTGGDEPDPAMELGHG